MCCMGCQPLLFPWRRLLLLLRISMACHLRCPSLERSMNSIQPRRTMVVVWDAEADLQSMYST